ncbi:hypothetical protein BH11BAC1_BH11BAC1_14440 [soil metagenome]
MKKKYLLIALFLLAINFSYGQEDTIYSIAYTQTAFRNFDLNDRDTGNYFFFDTIQGNNIWQIGTPYKTIFNAAYSAPLALVTDTLNSYPDSNTSSFSFTIFTDDYTIISFWHQINSDSLIDGGVVEYSTDGGTSYNNILNSSFFLSNFYSTTSTISSNSSKAGFTGTSGWVQSFIHGYALNYVKFKFTFTSDNINTNKDGWMIDDLFVNCSGTGINEIGRNSPFHIYPNPTSNYISISSNNTAKIFSVTIKNIIGQNILTTDKTTVDLSHLDTGIYFVYLKTDIGNFETRAIRL